MNSPTPELIRAVLDDHERGLTLDAFHRAVSFAPLAEWRGVEASCCAARLAANLGGSRLSTRLGVRAWRENSSHPMARLLYATELLEKRGPVAVWLAMRSWKDIAGASEEQQADFLAMKARAAILLRDFSEAESLLGRAESMAPKSAWIRLGRSHLLETQERVEEALEIAEATRAMHPSGMYRPAAQYSAQLLQLLDRDDDAISLLQKADSVVQSGPLAAQLYAILSEHGRWTEADAALDRYVTLSPLLEPSLQKWVDSQRSRVAYHLGRRDDAARLARGIQDDFHKGFAERLTVAPPEKERVQMEVTFVRQHFKTCAPATLAALGAYWRMPAEHLKLAEAVCYDGTPHWQQRQWAEANGWHVCEFTVTHESAVALIDRGIPFAIAIVYARSAHMMAVVGFDRTRATLLLRDPGQPYVVEVAGREFLKRYAAYGPHGMVFLPVDKKNLLDGLNLGDSPNRDECHRFWLALSKHDRAGAAEVLARMENSAPDHAITLETKLSLAGYDANTGEEAKCLDKLLELFPNSPSRILRRFNCLRNAPRDERIKFLEQACSAKEADPALYVELARVLQDDARDQLRMKHWLKRSVRLHWMDSNTIGVMADLHWTEEKREEATELYRFAANLEGFREDLYRTWFIACRQTRRTQEAMTHLGDRFARFGRRSEQPGITLAWALREMEQPGRAKEVLEEASRLRPEDGYLMLRSAALVAGLGHSGEAARLLGAAKSKVRENDWLRSAAEIAEIEFDTHTALKHARELLAREPLALDAHAGVARALAGLEGTKAALEHLKSACCQFPHHCGLRRLRIDWSREGGSEATEAAARELVQLDRSDAWSRRELAMALGRSNHLEEALAEATESVNIEPRNSYGYSILGHVSVRLGRLKEARGQFRRAVELSVDNTDALETLLSLAGNDRERKEELALIERELIRQVVHGDGLLTYLNLAQPIVDAQTLLGMLRMAHRERPDLWHAWSALLTHLGNLGQLHEARDLAVAATEKFPHLPRLWLDLGLVHQWRKEPEEEIKAAERAFEINPSWTRCALALADALERRGKLHDAQKIYERALKHSTKDPQLHAYYAHLLWRQRKKDAAFASIETALRIASGFQWAWGLLQNWAVECGEPERTADFARTLSRERPGDSRIWMILARALGGASNRAERFEAVEKALELEPTWAEVWDLKAESLARAEQFAEAIQSCEEGVKVCTLDSHVLQGRRAWIEAQRRQFAEATRIMRAVLAENANYAWGWSLLSQWLSEQGKLEEAADALEKLQRLRPHEAWVGRQLGFLRLDQKNEDAAAKAFAEALRIEPTDVGAAHNLLYLQLKSPDLKSARETLRLMQIHQPGARTIASEVLIKTREKDQAGSLKALKALCQSPDPDAWPIDAAVDAFKEAGWSGTAFRVLKREMKADACNPQVATAAIRHLLDWKHEVRALWLFLQLKSGEAQRRAAAPLVKGLAGIKARLSMRWLLWRRREVLKADAAAWGQVGYALVHFNRMREVARWLSDWRSRTEVEPWMLFNLCLALRHGGQYEEATIVARHAMEKWGHREGSADLRLFLAVEDALAGELPAARENLKLAAIRDNVDHDKKLLAMARVLVEFQEIPISERAERFRSVRRELRNDFTCWYVVNAMKDIRRTFRRTGKVIAGKGGGWKARLWFGWRLNWPWALLPLAPLMAVIALQPPVLVGIVIWRLMRKRNL